MVYYLTSMEDRCLVTHMIGFVLVNFFHCNASDLVGFFNVGSSELLCPVNDWHKVDPLVYTERHGECILLSLYDQLDKSSAKHYCHLVGQIALQHITFSRALAYVGKIKKSKVTLPVT